MKRSEILNNIAEIIDAKSYLEIGCAQDECFNRIKVVDKIGVDPICGGTHRMTSDDFFIHNNKTFDLIFIDGLHMYDQVMRDIKNSLASLNDAGIIAMHDTLPVHESSQIVPLSAAQKHPDFKGGWLGDVWKAVVDIRQSRSIDVCTIPIPCGLTLIKKAKNRNPLPCFNNNKLNWQLYTNLNQKLLNVINSNEMHSWIKS